MLKTNINDDTLIFIRNQSLEIQNREYCRRLIAKISLETFM